MTRWLVRVTWHEGMPDSTVSVESYEGNERTSCVVLSGSLGDEVVLTDLARSIQAATHPRLF